MKFWFDTEFYEDGMFIDLISIGVAAEDGRTYYAEVLGADAIAATTDWLCANVRPHLTGKQKPRSLIRDEIVEFMGDAPEIWAYYADYDWVALCQLHGTMMDLPKGWPMYCRDLKQLVDQCGNPKLPEQKSAEHNALADAIWTKEAWLWLRDRQTEIDRRRVA
jgi:3'-5' exoribonuclease-like protein